jgi:hypothetical protein
MHLRRRRPVPGRRRVTILLETAPGGGERPGKAGRWQTDVDSAQLLKPTSCGRRARTEALGERSLATFSVQICAMTVQAESLRGSERGRAERQARTLCRRSDVHGCSTVCLYAPRSDHGTSDDQPRAAVDLGHEHRRAFSLASQSRRASAVSGARSGGRGAEDGVIVDGGDVVRVAEGRRPDAGLVSRFRAVSAHGHGRRWPRACRTSGTSFL